MRGSRRSGPSLRCSVLTRADPGRPSRSLRLGSWTTCGLAPGLSSVWPRVPHPVLRVGVLDGSQREHIPCPHPPVSAF